MHNDEDQAGPADNPADGMPSPAPRWRRLRFWRSPSDQPRWARPALLAVAAVAAFSYAWGDTGLNLETFYATATRSMSESWHNFFFASFDSWGTVSIDKLPGAFWLQALSLRLFGFHLWAIALPQVVEGTLTVLVLYRVVRRLAGAGGGLVAALALVLSPVTVLLNRGNISDSLLILLFVLAADATTRALMSGRWQALVLAGVWIGLAFQAKMLQAWLVLPALAIAYVVAAPVASLARRCSHVVLMGLVTLVVSLSWMTAVTLVPAHDRPYTDGSCNNSVFSQVFLYNGADRLTGHVLTQAGCRPTPPPLVALAEHSRARGVGTVAAASGPGKFLTGIFGRLDGWFFLPSLVAFVALVVVRRKEPRTDAVRAGAILWLAWLVLTWAFFSSSHSINSYYLAALVPPMAALCGMGMATAWRRRAQSQRARAVLALTVAGGSLYAITLVPAGAGVRAWILVTSGVIAVIALGLIAASAQRSERSRWLQPVTFGAATLALLLGPAWASATAVADNLGPFETPYQPVALTNLLHAEAQRALDDSPALIGFTNRFPPSVAVDTFESSDLAASDVLLTGREFLPVGGFTGRVPEPTLQQFEADVAAGKVARVLVHVRPLTTNPILLWVRAHCQTESGPGGSGSVNGVRYVRYQCLSADLAHQAR